MGSPVANPIDPPITVANLITTASIKISNGVGLFISFDENWIVDEIKKAESVSLYVPSSRTVARRRGDL
ncbi:hypothetical protein L1887_32421 [Cichorium endivia]|nr:hypothetical protein L1887_32421 [Cichorium endivia]